MTDPACYPRSAHSLTLEVETNMVESSPRYRRRDVTGDDAPETFCNTFLSDITADLGAPVPWLLANEQLDWLDSERGRLAGWTRAGTEEALAAIGRGEVVVVGWPNPGGHGHVALGVPGTPGLGIHVAQAGRTNFSCRPVESGFGRNPVTLWRHA